MKLSFARVSREFRRSFVVLGLPSFARVSPEFRKNSVSPEFRPSFGRVSGFRVSPEFRTSFARVSGEFRTSFRQVGPRRARRLKNAVSDTFPIRFAAGANSTINVSAEFWPSFRLPSFARVSSEFRPSFGEQLRYPVSRFGCQNIDFTLKWRWGKGWLNNH